MIVAPLVRISYFNVINISSTGRNGTSIKRMGCRVSDGSSGDFGPSIAGNDGPFGYQIISSAGCVVGARYRTRRSLHRTFVLGKFYIILLLIHHLRQFCPT